MRFAPAFYQHDYFTHFGSPTDPDALDERMHKAADEYAPQFSAISPQTYVQPRVDVLGALAIVARSAPRIATLREAIESEAPKFALRLVDELIDLTLAIAWAQGEYDLGTGEHDELGQVVSAAQRVRESFLTWLEALADKGFADARRLAVIRRGTGHADVADDLSALTAMLREAWPAVGNRTLLHAGEFDEADRLVAKIRELIAQRTRATADVSELARARQAAFTVLVRRWDEVRRVVSFVRWRDDDADEYAPSLFARSRSARRRAEPSVPAPIVQPVGHPVFEDKDSPGSPLSSPTPFAPSDGPARDDRLTPPMDEATIRRMKELEDARAGASVSGDGGPGWALGSAPAVVKGGES